MITAQHQTEIEAIEQDRVSWLRLWDVLDIHPVPLPQDMYVVTTVIVRKDNPLVMATEQSLYIYRHPYMIRIRAITHHSEILRPKEAI